MDIRFDRTGSASGLKEITRDILKNKDIKTLFVLGCDLNDFTPELLDPFLKSLKIPIYGGLFPSIVFNNEKIDKGTIICGITTESNIKIIHEISNKETDFEFLIGDTYNHYMNMKTMFIIVDGISKRIAELIESLFNIYGLDINYLGGSAGSMSFEMKPCVISNEGLLQDAAIIVGSEIKSGVGVNHGWKSINKVFRVTESDKNTIYSLNWRPAFEVYKEVVEEHSGKKLTKESFFSLAKYYPLAISKLDAESIVRAPFYVGKDDSIVCFGEVHQESVIEIFTSDPDSIINAAEKALNSGMNAFSENESDRLVVFIDCISRSLVLGNKFQEELNVVSKTKFQTIGALTLGEIANNGKDYLEFYNTTAVIGVLSK